jgi:hypothetical protein
VGKNQLNLNEALFLVIFDELCCFDFKPLLILKYESALKKFKS